MVAQHLSHAQQWIWQDGITMRNGISLVSLVWLVWEVLVTVEEEYKYIWRSRLTVIKCLYFIARYVALVGQLANVILSTILLSRAPLSEDTCQMWFGFQALITQIVITTVEAILFLRVYALYQNDRKIRILLGVLFSLQNAVLLVTALRVTLGIRFSPTCLVDRTPVEVVFMGIFTVAVQLILLGLILNKHRRASRKKVQAIPVLRLVVRDGVIVCLIICAFFCFCVSYTYFVHELTNSMFSILITLLSIIGCRVIMNMQKLKLPGAGSTVLEFTTCFDTRQLDSALDFAVDANVMER